MLKMLFIIAITSGIVFCAYSQLTNQVLITPSLRFELLETTAARRTNRFNSNEQIIFSVTSTDDKGHVFALFPEGRSFIFDLRDAKGNLIKKTAIGIQASQPIDIETIIRKIKIEHPSLTDQQRANLLPAELQIKHHPVNPNQAFFSNVLIPENYFVISNKGIYTLDLQVHAWVQKTNNQYGVVVSPPVRVEIEKR